uniref:hypothetical protein n=1 Tax=Flavobacterium sp. TaxID=239 RepID=UPI004049B3ED
MKAIRLIAFVTIFLYYKKSNAQSISVSTSHPSISMEVKNMGWTADILVTNNDASDMYTVSYIVEFTLKCGGTKTYTKKNIQISAGKTNDCGGYTISIPDVKGCEKGVSSARVTGFTAIAKVNNATNTPITKTYPNINARFIPQTENGKQSIAAQFTNTTINTTKSVAIKILTRDINNKTIKQEVFVLKSGEAITKKLGEADSYEINVSEPFDYDHPKESVDYFTEKIKNWTKEVIQKKELDNRKSSSVGVRG